MAPARRWQHVQFEKRDHSFERVLAWPPVRKVDTHNSRNVVTG